MAKEQKSSKNTSGAKATATALADIFPRMMVNMSRLGGGKSSTILSLTAPQMRALFAIHIEGGMMHMSALASALGVTQSTATDVTNRLMRMGYLQKDRLAGDKRVVCVSLTKEGKRIARDMKAEKFQQFLAICEALTEKKQQRLLKSHRLILDIYSAMQQG